jgi:hypothetical protein
LKIIYKQRTRGETTRSTSSPLTITWQADLAVNDKNAQLWATILREALYTVTENLDAWFSIQETANNIRLIVSGLKADDSNDFPIFYNQILDRMRFSELKSTLACSPAMREYFRIDKASPNDEGKVVSRGLAKDIDHPGAATLASILRVMSDPVANQYVPHEDPAWLKEISGLVCDGSEIPWMTGHGIKQVSEYLSTSFVFAGFKRTWDYYQKHLTDNPNDEKYSGWKNYRRHSDNLRAIDIEEFVKIAEKHLVPCPEKRFFYVGHPIFLFLRSTGQNEVRGKILLRV